MRPYGAAFVLAVCACSSGPTAPDDAVTRDEITGGEVDDGAEAHPAVVYLTASNFACSATLIAPNLAITARHCVSENLTQVTSCDIFGNSLNGDHVGNDIPAGEIQFRTGVTTVGPVEAVGSQVFHPPGGSLCNADIALVVLNQPILGVTPQKIRSTAPPLIGELATAVGYGKTSPTANNGGTRRRRADVPIISVGQDLNETNMQEELIAGQAICAGDSGGPLISTGGAVIGLAARASNCSDPSSHPRYTRLDSHQALIDQAFAAAGATPSLETGTGTPPAKLATGEGPCTTGAECTSLICTKGSSQLCTQFCNETPCPAGTQCKDGIVPKGDGSVVEGKICLPLPETNACETCRAVECVNLATTCLSSASCAAALSCVDACADADCVAACNASGVEYEELTDCVCGSDCSADCTNQCGGAPIAGTGGTSGAGGSSGSGGSSGGATKASSSDDSGGCQMRTGSAQHSWFLALALFLVRRKRAAKSAR